MPEENDAVAVAWCLEHLQDRGGGGVPLAVEVFLDPGCAPGSPRFADLRAALVEVGVAFRPELSPAASDTSPGPMDGIVAEARRRFVRCRVGMDGLALLLHHPAVLKVAPDFPVMPLAPGGAS